VRKVLAVLAVLLIAGAFVAGYWPQRQRLIQAQAEAAEARRQLSEARSELAVAAAKARLGLLFGEFLTLQDAVVTGNYGEAQTLSSPFFDRVRSEAGKVSDAKTRTALDAVLMRRDAVTAGIARGEGSVREVLVPIETELRRALGYPLPSLAPATPTAAESGPR
jgi:type II secretory pathway pseudopilin PulG